MGMGRAELIALLQIPKDREKYLFELSTKAKLANVGNLVFLRGLIEISNICHKNCYYCGIRRDSKHATRYNLDDNDIIESAIYAHKNGYGSLALQAGELENEQNTQRIEKILREIQKLSNGELGVTLSLGEQNYDVYERWRKAGASRYLLRIETSSAEFYKTLHPNDSLHNFDRRVECLKTLRELDYQVGTGVMIGLPNQTAEILADDLLFFKDLDIDMCGMGPYLENPDSMLPPATLSLEERFDLTLRMIAILRIMMPKVNIAATTALQAIDPLGREKALQIGANVIMPNITPVSVRKNYKLYDNKPISEDCLDIQDKTLFERIREAGCEIGFGIQGNSLHYTKKEIFK